MLPALKVALHGIAAPEASIRAMQRELAQLSARDPAITGGRFTLANCGPEVVEAHLELLLPRHQVIVNAVATAERSVREVFARAAERLALVACRDPAIAPTERAKAA